MNPRLVVYSKSNKEDLLELGKKAKCQRRECFLLRKQRTSQSR